MLEKVQEKWWWSRRRRCRWYWWQAGKCCSAGKLYQFSRQKCKLSSGAFTKIKLPYDASNSPPCRLALINCRRSWENLVHWKMLSSSAAMWKVPFSHVSMPTHWRVCVRSVVFQNLIFIRLCVSMETSALFRFCVMKNGKTASRFVFIKIVWTTDNHWALAYTH